MQAMPHKRIPQFGHFFQLLKTILCKTRRHLRRLIILAAQNLNLISSSYELWQTQHALDVDRYRDAVAKLKLRPEFSLFISDENSRPDLLEKTIDSLREQLYPDWFLIIRKQPAREKPDDVDTRIHYDMGDRQMANGKNPLSYLAIIEAGDQLSPHALAKIAMSMDPSHPQDIIYTDEDELDGRTERRQTPRFKPDWSPDLLLTQPYLGNLTFFRSQRVVQLGGVDWSMQLSAAHDLALRISDQAVRVFHIPEILFHRRWSDASRSQSEHTTAVVERAIKRRKLPVRVSEDERCPGLVIPHWELPGEPLISIIILDKDKPKYLNTCLASIFKLTSYHNFELLLVDTGSTDPDSLSLYQHWLGVEPDRFRLIRNEEAFNFARMNNMAVERARGSLILFLNNDTRLLTARWLEEMAGQALRKEVGAVGSVLEFPNRTIQHAGIIRSCSQVALHLHYRRPAQDCGHLGRLRVPSEVSMLTAACLMIRKDLFMQVGRYDEKLGIAYNDTDLCLKLNQAGYRNILLPQVRLIHHESATRGSDLFSTNHARFIEEQTLFKNRWEPMGVDPYYSPNC